MLVKLCPIEGEVCAELLTSRGRDRASAKRKHLGDVPLDVEKREAGVTD
jgi:hypothetical protein